MRLSGLDVFLHHSLISLIFNKHYSQFLNEKHLPKCKLCKVNFGLLIKLSSWIPGQNYKVTEDCVLSFTFTKHAITTPEHTYTTCACARRCT